MNMAPNMAMGGGGAPMEQQPQAPQFQPQQFSQQQIMQRAGGADMDQRKAYQAELINQLRGGTFKDAQGVWGNALNNYDQTQQQNAFQTQQQQAMQQQQQDASSQNWFAGDGG